MDVSIRKSPRYFTVIFILSLSLLVSFHQYACAGSAPAERKKLGVMTLNVWSGLDYVGTLKMGEYESPETREARFQALVKEIKTLSPDVIGINEANFLPDYVKRLAGRIDYDYIYHVGVSGLHLFRIGIPWNLKEGDAILAKKDLNLKYVGRKQLSKSGFTWNSLSFHLDDLTQVLVGSITVNNQEFYIAVTHLHASPANNDLNIKKLRVLKKKFGYSDEEFKTSLKMLREGHAWRMDESGVLLNYLDEIVPDKAPLMLIGDFNAEPDSPEMELFKDAGFFDSYKQFSDTNGFTWNAEKNLNINKFYGFDENKKPDDLFSNLNKQLDLVSGRIDYILANKEVQKNSVINSMVCADKITGGVHTSDHFGVFTLFILN